MKQTYGFTRSRSPADLEWIDEETEKRRGPTRAVETLKKKKKKTYGLQNIP
jgi:hypothetical protein